MMKIAALAGAFLVCATVGAAAQDTSMSFFVTSVNPGKGGDLGGFALPIGGDLELALVEQIVADVRPRVLGHRAELDFSLEAQGVIDVFLVYHTSR